jgi:hypothetical protein
MTAAEIAALEYTAGGRRVFPCRDKNTPRVRWRDQATTDEALIREWFGRRWPRDLIGTPTGEVDVVLDVDPPAGLETLAELGFPLWLETSTAHTPRGGLHGHFEIPPGNIRNTTGKKGRGIGVNVDWRGLGGYVVLPTPGSGYSWDPVYGRDFSLAPVPEALLPRPAEPSVDTRPTRPETGLSPYAEAALKSACQMILRAPCGEQEATLHAQCFAIGTLAGAGVIPADFARRELLWVARQISDYDPKRPWRANEIERQVNRSFGAGLERPR